jgi:hypothetical protein
MPLAVVNPEIAAHRRAVREADAASQIIQWRANRIAWLYRRPITIDHEMNPGELWKFLNEDGWHRGRPHMPLPPRPLLEATDWLKFIISVPVADALIKRDSGETTPRIFALPESWMPPALG